MELEYISSKDIQTQKIEDFKQYIRNKDKTFVEEKIELNAFSMNYLEEMSKEYNMSIEEVGSLVLLEVYNNLYIKELKKEEANKDFSDIMDSYSYLEYLTNNTTTQIEDTILVLDFFNPLHNKFVSLKPETYEILKMPLEEYKKISCETKK